MSKPRDAGDDLGIVARLTWSTDVCEHGDNRVDDDLTRVDPWGDNVQRSPQMSGFSAEKE